MCVKISVPNYFLYKKFLSDSKRFLAHRTVEMNWDEFRRDEKDWSIYGWDVIEKNTYLDNVWEEMGWNEKSWDEVRRIYLIWDEMKCRVRKMQIWSAKCRIWRVQCEVWGKSFLGIALQRGRAQVMLLDNNIVIASHKARKHGPGCARRIQIL